MPALPTLLALLLATAALWIALTILLTARAILRPQRMTDGRAIYFYRRLSPGDFNLEFSVVNFDVRDARSDRSIKIVGWWIPHPQSTGKCVVLIHDFADAKIGPLDRAPELHNAGFNILAIDLRAHGESGGRNFTAGYFERDDLDNILNQLQVDRPADCRSVVLHGIGCGAAVAIATAARRDDIAAVTVEHLFEDYRQFLADHAGAIGLPSGFLLRISIRCAEILSGADFTAVRPRDLIEKLKCPIESK